MDTIHEEDIKGSCRIIDATDDHDHGAGNAHIGQADPGGSTGAGGYKAWLGISALVFGTFCGANMASGVYATTYMLALGGGWMWPCLLTFILFMAFFCAVSLDFIRAYRVDHYNAFYLALWGADRPGASRLFRTIITVFFDIYTTLSGLITVAATIALFASLVQSLFHIPMLAGGLIALIVDTILSMYGAEFLMRFNVIKTIALVVSLAVILAVVIVMRGEILATALFDYNTGMSWGRTTVTAHIGLLISYCFSTASWGGSLSNYASRIVTKKDAICSGILMGVMVAVLFLATSMIVLPFLPEAFVDAPILAICESYMPGWITAIYWAVAMLSVVTTGPTFIFSTANRFARVWRTERVPHRVKLFIIALVFLILCLGLSQFGLIALCQKGYTALGNVAIVAIAAPLVVSIIRVRRRDQAARTAWECNR